MTEGYALDPHNNARFVGAVESILSRAEKENVAAELVVHRIRHELRMLRAANAAYDKYLRLDAPSEPPAA
jgi:hypothetical protein